MRVKRGTVSRRKHNKLKKLAKGFRGRRKNVFSFVKNAVEKSLKYAYVGRKQNKRNMRSLWIVRINAAARLNDISYSQLIKGMNKANIAVDRRVLAQLAVEDATAFAAIANQAKQALAA
jgi:large subunit ribosomal protein L20